MEFSHTEDEINAIYAVYAGEDGMMDYSEFLTFITGGTSKSENVKRAIHPNHRPAGECKMMEKSQPKKNIVAKQMRTFH